MAEEAASSGLFSIFLLSIYTLVLLPYTIYRCCASDETTTVVKVRLFMCCRVCARACVYGCAQTRPHIRTRTAPWPAAPPPTCC